MFELLVPVLRTFVTVKNYDCMDDWMHGTDFLGDAQLPLSLLSQRTL